MRISSAFSVAAALAMLPAAAIAANWQPVANAGRERVEIDEARIMRTAPGKTMAWTRLVLGRELKDAGGSYTAIQAMNRYDCEARRFATLRRVYMNGERAVREETVGSPKDVAAAAGSVDAILLAEACKPRNAGEVRMVATDAVPQTAMAQEGKIGAMYADMRTAGEQPKTHTVQVADAAKPEVGAAETPGAPRPGSAAETRIEIRPPSERPRYIDLPKLQRPQPADAAEAKAPEAKAPETGTAQNKTAVKPAEKVAPAPPPAASRNERERIYATSGPRRAPAARQRPVEEHAERAVVEHRDIHWNYEGEGGPANWGKLRSDYGLCATGRRQSPIDIREGIRVDLEPIRFDYRPTQFRIVDNGHTVEVDVGEGSTISVMNRTYQLLQFHFHRPSEERINGKAFDMVIHLVHRDDMGRIAVVAVLLEKGAENPLIQTLWNNMPLEENQDVTPAVAVDLNALLPENRAYYTYMGSLTTPPCTEDVLWMVFKQPMPVSAEQVAIFSRLYRNNARPIQPSNNRLIKENR